ncbi:MAG TPA: EscU/YscU/HrcU family type III secretion system export apparatus switch protein [Solirubrobacteraceae bacterium]|nr:EscU/YscU/HrcU family type III secretion system export apparatus switch protein [Solirubrobacteraceae bacterium]
MCMPEDRKRRATALHYEHGERAPRVTATGTGLVAERIIAAAREAGVPVRHDPGLAQALGALELGDDVPEELWTAVAETLAWAYKLDREAAGSG